MEFIQQREYPNFGLSYEIQYSLEELDSQIAGIILIEADTEWDENELASIESTEDLALSFELAESDIRQIHIDFELTYPNRTAGGKVLTTVSDGENTSELHLQIPPIQLLLLYRRLLKPELSVQAHEQLESILDDYDSQLSISDIINCSPYAITRSELITVLDRIGEYDSSLKKPLKDFIINELTDWIHHQNVGKYYGVNNPGELESLVTEFNKRKISPHLINRY